MPRSRSGPVSLCHGAEASFELSMKALNETMGCWMVGCCPDVGGSEETHELVPNVRFKLCTVISGDCGRNTTTCYPAGDKGLSNSRCGYVG